jgi:hypothetical protein
MRRDSSVIDHGLGLQMRRDSGVIVANSVYSAHTRKTMPMNAMMLSAVPVHCTETKVNTIDTPHAGVGNNVVCGFPH